MAALDFPSSPTVGQKYNPASGASYTWDGEAWTLGGPITASPVGPAGGDLAGSSYPNPVLAPGVVTLAKLAPGAAVAGVAFGGVTSPQAASGTLTPMMTATLTGFRGGNVLVFAYVWGVVTTTATGASYLQLQLQADGVTIADYGHAAVATGPFSGGLQVPYTASYMTVAAPAAGTRVFTARVAYTGVTTTWWVEAGLLQVVGLA